ncbi:MAG: ankyrin repeat domain-containing protein [Candidatus Thiodiazotropha sp.]
MSITLDQKVIFAARSGNLELLKERIASGGSVNTYDPKHGSALIAAIGNGHKAIISYLIENGVDVNHEHHDGIGPLEVALRNPNPEIVKLLAWSGAKLRKKTREYYGKRLEECLRNG